MKEMRKDGKKGEERKLRRHDTARQESFWEEKLKKKNFEREKTEVLRKRKLSTSIRPVDPYRETFLQFGSSRLEKTKQSSLGAFIDAYQQFRRRRRRGADIVVEVNLGDACDFRFDAFLFVVRRSKIPRGETLAIFQVDHFQLGTFGQPTPSLVGTNAVARRWSASGERRRRWWGGRGRGGDCGNVERS